MEFSLLELLSLGGYLMTYVKTGECSRGYIFLVKCAMGCADGRFEGCLGFSIVVWNFLKVMCAHILVGYLEFA